MRAVWKWRQSVQRTDDRHPLVVISSHAAAEWRHSVSLRCVQVQPKHRWHMGTLQSSLLVLRSWFFWALCDSDPRNPLGVTVVLFSCIFQFDDIRDWGIVKQLQFNRRSWFIRTKLNIKDYVVVKHVPAVSADTETHSLQLAEKHLTLNFSCPKLPDLLHIIPTNLFLKDFSCWETRSHSSCRDT